jgi:hypothetical protein
MKIILTISLIAIFSTTNFSQSRINGVWELKGEKIRGAYMYSNHSFWVKFSDERIIISNSNNKFSQIWSCDIGKWHQSSDTIFIKIFENENVQPHSSMMSHKKTNKIKDIRFIINAISDSNIELLPLDRFIGSRIKYPENRVNFMVNPKIGIEEKFQWSDKNKY